jgi:hypothetical protein
MLNETPNAMPHEVTVIKGRRFPTCRHFKGISFELAHAAKHVGEIDHHTGGGFAEPKEILVERTHPLYREVKVAFTKMAAREAKKEAKRNERLRTQGQSAVARIGCSAARARPKIAC